MSEKPIMLWVARDNDRTVWAHTSAPTLADGVWYSHGHAWPFEFEDAFPYLQPGECYMFVEFAPRVAETDIEEMEMVWMGGAWGVDYPSYGDIILPMPPDPTPYLTPADPNAARREEIRAQIGALQAELDGMEG